MITLADHIDDFVADVARRRDWRPSTRRAYHNDLLVIAQRLPIPLAAITEAQLDLVLHDADNLGEFLSLLGVGYDYLDIFTDWYQPVKLDTQLVDFRQWLLHHPGLAVPPDPEAVVWQARQNHPSLDDWLFELDKQQGADEAAL